MPVFLILINPDPPWTPELFSITTTFTDPLAAIAWTVAGEQVSLTDIEVEVEVLAESGDYWYARGPLCPS